MGDLRLLGAPDEGLHLSVLLPTHRAGPDTQQGPIRLKNLAGSVRRSLADADLPTSEVDDLLEPIEALIDDPEFWQHQAGGLALYRSHDRWHRFRVPHELPEVAAVAGSFATRPLLSSITSAETFVLVALSQSKIRVLECTEATVREVQVPDLPSSMEEALAHEDNERQLQVRAGGDAGMFHGHGAGDEIDKAEVERFLRAVDRPLARHLAGTGRPVLLASVAYYAPIFRAVTSHDRVLDAVVEGNPDHRSDEQLHEAAWPLVAPLLAQPIQEDLDRLRAGAGAGTTAEGIGAVLEAAEQGRIECLFATDGPVRWGTVEGGTVGEVDEPTPSSVDLVGRAAALTLANGGRMHTVAGGELADDAPVAATLRY